MEKELTTINLCERLHIFPNLKVGDVVEYSLNGEAKNGVIISFVCNSYDALVFIFSEKKVTTLDCHYLHRI